MQTEKLPVSRILGMESEIVHYKKYGKIISESIFYYAINYYLHIVDSKIFLFKGKGAVVSTFFRERELKSQERIFLLRLIVNEFVKRRPSDPEAGLTVDEVIELLYGRLWYKHIRNESFQYKVTLLMNRLPFQVSWPKSVAAILCRARRLPRWSSMKKNSATPGSRKNSAKYGPPDADYYRRDGIDYPGITRAGWRYRFT
jgi:hypothetical protein